MNELSGDCASVVMPMCSDVLIRSTGIVSLLALPQAQHTSTHTPMNHRNQGESWTQIPCTGVVRDGPVVIIVLMGCHSLTSLLVVQILTDTEDCVSLSFWLIFAALTAFMELHNMKVINCCKYCQHCSSSTMHECRVWVVQQICV